MLAYSKPILASLSILQLRCVQNARLQSKRPIGRFDGQAELADIFRLPIRKELRLTGQRASVQLIGMDIRRPPAQYP